MGQGKFYVSGDCKVLQLVAGIKGSGASAPCYDCCYHKSRDKFEKVHAERTPVLDLLHFLEFNDRSIDFGQHKEHLLPGAELVLPLLHVLLGIVNHFMKKFEAKVGQQYVVDKIYKEISVSTKKYFGGNLEGNGSVS